MRLQPPAVRTNEIEKQIKRDFSKHQVTEFANTKHAQIYRCQQPGTWINGFDIILAPTCITVSGDIGEVLYTVGRGLKFLAGYGCSSYGFEKLDDAYRNKKEVNNYALAEYVYNLIYDLLELENINSKYFPEELIPPSEIDESKPEKLQLAIEFLWLDVLEKLYLPDEYIENEEYPEWLNQIEVSEENLEIIYNMSDHLRDHDYTPDEHELYQIIRDTHWDDIDPEWFDGGFLVEARSVSWVTSCAQWAAAKWLEENKSEAA
ncbi:hypothetical protein [Spartinivicinus poritis]|uniref:Uncharacterized protein n=1 Tax=Spartinivicinus poritis TaxID=2994640 RepID=A0ABT5UKM1_9GAMM|nr:hypothetical protein [Spartinivicinus sp. A2-2]MDE1466032.1 hypothetical protein [Spartinivicinus sp. A2-2]